MRIYFASLMIASIAIIPRSSNVFANCENIYQEKIQSALNTSDTIGFASGVGAAVGVSIVAPHVLLIFASAAAVSVPARNLSRWAFFHKSWVQVYTLLNEVKQMNRILEASSGELLFTPALRKMKKELLTALPDRVDPFSKDQDERFTNLIVKLLFEANAEDVFCKDARFFGNDLYTWKEVREYLRRSIEQWESLIRFL